MTKQDKRDALSHIMRDVHALADLAWPNDGVTVMPADALTAIIDIQMTACRALGLPEEMNLLTGNPAFDDF